VYLCVLHGSENKQQLFPRVALTIFVNNRGVYLLRITECTFMYDRLDLSLNGRAVALVISRWPFTAENRV
jgi:hypothetical protein